ncbi:hypothetical protein GX95_23345 (plasmid) [Salmonella enterica subsp. enterica serovar Minnesota]|nr:hypothetical protein GX95_23345 [Salmonella enterica subsp. enterica serovar Minnesota]
MNPEIRPGGRISQRDFADTVYRERGRFNTDCRFQAGVENCVTPDVHQASFGRLASCCFSVCGRFSRTGMQSDSRQTPYW